MTTLLDTFNDFFNTPEECSFCGGTDNLFVSKTDMYGEPCLWHHAECKAKHEQELEAERKEAEKRIAIHNYIAETDN